MKAFLFILVFGLARLLLPGCSTAPGCPPAMTDGAEDQDGAVLLRASVAPGNAEAFAHFAAGESCVDNDDAPGALRQWDAAALADPSNERLVIQVAGDLLQNKENDKAVALLSKSASRPDASAAVLAWLARVQLQTNHFKQALAASKLAIERQPDALDGYECQLEVLLKQKQWAEAAKTLQRASRRVRSDPGLLLALAELHAVYLKNQPKDTEAEAQAVALLDRVAQILKNQPKDTQTEGQAESLLDRAAQISTVANGLWQRLAEDYARFNQEKKAEVIYTRLLADSADPSPQRDSLHEKLAGLYIQSDDRTNAMKELQALIGDNPARYPRAWFVLGELAYENTKPDEAAEDFAKALRWDPTIEQAYYDLALALLDLKKNTEALDILEQARARFPNTFSCEFYSGVVYAHAKDFSEAIRHFKEAEVIALAANPSRLDERFYFQIGAACERDHSYKQAEEYLQKCVVLAPDFAEALNYLGYMLADRGEQLPRARVLIQKAVSLDPRNGAFLDSLGWVLFKLNQPRQALPQLLKAMQYTPEPDATVLDHLGEVYLALHQTDKAVEAWRKSYSIEANDDVRRKLEQYSGGSL